MWRTAWGRFVALIAGLVLGFLPALMAPSAGLANAPTSTATFTYPLDGAQNVDTSQPFTWTSVQGAQAYYLYVGTSQGAKDLVDSYETQTTSYQVPGLPIGQTLWARIWTKQADGSWTYQDIQFVTEPATPTALSSSSTATFTYPSDGAPNVDATRPFTWTSIPGARAYYLYVGSSQGAKDLVDSYEIQTTSYQVPALPTGHTLWARIWTEHATGSWTYQDIKFIAGASTNPTFSYPQDGATNVDPAVPFSWYAVPNAQAYYLYVGTSQGAKDLVDSYEIHTTSYQVPALPKGQTLWARIWVEVGGTWTFQDISFQAAAPSRAAFTYPLDGSTAVNTARVFTWTAAASAQAYYVYVGTSQGANNLANSGSLPASQTTYQAPPLPLGQTLWARVWTEVNGSWQSADVSFQVAISAATLTYPQQGATNVDSSKSMAWLPAADAQAYYVWLGTTPGGKDLLDSGSIPASQTSYPLPTLAIGQTLYARLYTEVNGSWSIYTDVSFVAGYSAATLTYPNPQASGVNEDLALPFTWTPVSGASGYQLWIGTTPGGSDVLQTGLLTQTSYSTGPLPAEQPLWAEVWTLASGVWVHSPAVEVSGAEAIMAPAQQSLSADPTQPISWEPGPVLNNQPPTYELMLGTHPGGNDLFDSGSVTTASKTVPGSAMPAGQPLYARVIYNLGDGTQRVTDTVFAAAGSNIQPSQMVWGGNGPNAVDTSLPFTWNAQDLAQAYRLEILDGSNSTVADSGAIQVPEYFDEALPAGTYTARLGTQLGGAWQWTTSTFTVTGSGSSAANEIAAAHWATDYVRHMADVNNYPYAWTDLWELANSDAFGYLAKCNDYSTELMTVLKQMNVTATLPQGDQPQVFNTYFSAADGHTMVQFWNSTDSDWIVLDPTFSIAMKRAGDGHWATLADAQAAALAQNWSAIQYVPLGDYAFTPVKNYYLDYPLMFLNPPGTTQWNSPMSYLTVLSSPPTNHWNVYTLTSNQSPVTVLIDGRAETLTPSSADGLVPMFDASTSALASGSSASVTYYRPNRYVFTGGAFG